MEKSLLKSRELEERFAFDSDRRRGGIILCGVDEAGRGPLAGDVYAAAVVFDDGVFIDGLNDSKKLSEKRREALFEEITQKARAHCIATASAEEIDAYNILQATRVWACSPPLRWLTATDCRRLTARRKR